MILTLLLPSASEEGWLCDLPNHLYDEPHSHGSSCLATNHHTSFHISYFQFAEKFQEVKEAAKLAKDKSQEKVETLSNHSQVNNVPLLSLHGFSPCATFQFNPFLSQILMDTDSVRNRGFKLFVFINI